MKRAIQARRITVGALICFFVGCACTNQSISPMSHGGAPNAPAPRAQSGVRPNIDSPAPPDNGGADAGTTLGPEVMRVRIVIGATTISATLSNNQTARAFRATLPFTLNMRDLNANEKHGQLPNSLPVDASSPGTIQAGDVMLYGANTLVLFYETFSTSYDYTRIGKCDDPSELAAALGSGDVTVTFAP